MRATVTRQEGSFNEATVKAAFENEGLSPSRWSNAPGDTYAAHSHPYHKILYCVRGSITFRLVDTGEDVELFPGDRLDIEPGTSHAAVAGTEGVTCIEAPR